MALTVMEMSSGQTGLLCGKRQMGGLMKNMRKRGFKDDSESFGVSNK